MGVLVGKTGAIIVHSSSKFGNITGSSSDGNLDPGPRGHMHRMLNLTNWSLSQPGPELIDATVFGSSWKHDKAGIRDGGTLSFSGYFDYADSTGQRAWSTRWRKGATIAYPVGATTTVADPPVHGFRLELWGGDTTLGGGIKAGFWKFSTAPGSTAEGRDLLITSYDVGQDKSGLGTMSMTMKISGGYFTFSTDPTTTAS